MRYRIKSCLIPSVAITNVSAYLRTLGVLRSYLPEYPSGQAKAAEHADTRDFEWFFESPEFVQWQSHNSEFLWLFGIPDSGKTVLSLLLWDRLRLNRRFNNRDDLLVFFCPPTNTMDPTPEMQIVRILSTLLGQLLRMSSKRLELVAKECPFPHVQSQKVPCLDDLWEIFSTSVTVLLERKITIIIDGIDAVRSQEARQSFLNNLKVLRAEVISRGVAGFKIFIASRPFEDIKEELGDFLSIEKDKERLRESKSPLDLFDVSSLCNQFQNACRP